MREIRDKMIRNTYKNISTTRTHTHTHTHTYTHTCSHSHTKGREQIYNHAFDTKITDSAHQSCFVAVFNKSAFLSLYLSDLDSNVPSKLTLHNHYVNFNSEYTVTCSGDYGFVCDSMGYSYSYATVSAGRIKGPASHTYMD